MKEHIDSLAALTHYLGPIFEDRSLLTVADLTRAEFVHLRQQSKLSSTSFEEVMTA